jgi:hypothetical protein
LLIANYSLGGGFAAFSRFSVLFAVLFPKLLQPPATNAFSQHLSPKLFQPSASFAFSQRIPTKKAALRAATLLIAHCSLLIANCRAALSP